MERLHLSLLVFVFGVLSACGDTGWTADQLLIPAQKSGSDTGSSPADLDDGFGHLNNLTDIIKELNLDTAQQRGFRGQGIKIAILDNGFADLDTYLGRSIPQGTRYEKNSQNPPAPTRHGTSLAELVYKISTGSETLVSGGVGPELLLYNSNGFSNFKESVQKAIAAKVDIILYAQVWEYGGNFDGRGFINSVVSEATNRGILWVNAAGNYKNRIWSGPVKTNAQQQLLFDTGNSSLPFRIRLGHTAFKASLAWNDFRDQTDYATVQDLDLILEDASGNEIQGGKKHQSGLGNKDSNDWSAHAKETINLDLENGNYTLRVIKNSDNFDEKSVVSVMVQGEFVELLAPPATNSILIPADNPTVITAGAQDDEFSARSVQKPEIQLTSKLNFSSGKIIQGSSTAAALAAAKLAVRLSEFGFMTRKQAIRTISQP
jgi:hypothetical protein